MTINTTATTLPTVIVCALLMGACATGRPDRAAYDAAIPPFADAQRIVDVTTGSVLEPAQAVARLLEARVIYIGEESPIPWHREVEAQIVGELAARDPALSVALAAVPAALQPLLDGWLAGELDDGALSAALRGSGAESDLFEAMGPVLVLCKRARVPILAIGADPAHIDAALRDDVSATGAMDRPPAWVDLVSHQARVHEGAQGPAVQRSVAAWGLRAAAAERGVVAARGGRLVVIAEHVLVDRGLGVPLPVFALTGEPFRVVLPITRGHLGRHDAELRRLAFPDKRADLLWESPTDPHGHGAPADEA